MSVPCARQGRHSWVVYVRRWASVAAGVVTALLLVSSCGAKDSVEVSALIEQKPYNKPVTGAEVGGRLILVADRCVGFAWRHKRPTVIVFPAGTSVTGHGHDFVVHVDGADLRLGGGFAAGTWGPGATSVEGLAGGLVSPPPGPCRQSPVVALNQFQH